MKVGGRAILVGTIVSAVIGVMALISFSIAAKITAAQQKDAGQWVDPANKSDELVDGPYRVDPNWPKPLATLFPEEKGWTWGAVQGVFAQNPDRVFVAMRGELPDLAGLKRKYVEVETAYGSRRTCRSREPGCMAGTRPWAPTPAPAKPPTSTRASRTRTTSWKHIITVYDSQGNVKEAWTQWDSLFGRPDPEGAIPGPRAQDI